MLTSDAMIGFLIILETGEIEKVGRCNASLFSRQDTGNGYLMAIDGEPPNPAIYYWSGEEFVEYPPKPNDWCKWNGSEWIDCQNEKSIIAMKTQEMREERDRRLAASDWAETPSAERRMSPELFEAWATYRQALRDLPEMTADPAKPVWPTPPKS